jgi:hypothetical protein
MATKPVQSKRLYLSEDVQWEDAPTEFTSRSGVVIELWGPTGSGRTSLALSAPGPIYLIQYHEKINGLVQKYAKSKEIKIFKAGGTFIGEPDEIRLSAWGAMEAAESAYYDSFKHARTVVIDTYPEAWELERLAEFGAPKPSSGPVQLNYGPPNNRWNSMVNYARDMADEQGINVFWIGQTEDEWKDTGGAFGKKTGKQVRVSNSAAAKVALKSNVRIELYKSGSNFMSKIIKGWFNADSEDVEFQDEDSTFANIIGTVTNTKPKEWL